MVTENGRSDTPRIQQKSVRGALLDAMTAAAQVVQARAVANLFIAKGSQRLKMNERMHG